ncbi:MAG: imelysin family protein [Bacteroidota bacterium]
MKIRELYTKFFRDALIVTTISLLSCEMKSVTDEEFASAAENYADIVLANYQDSYDQTIKLKELIGEFVADPTKEGFTACKEQWLKARIPYGQTEAFRFYGGPIDDEDGPEGLINAWPMDENYIDYVEGDETAGMINNLEEYPEITKALLVKLNESFSEESIFTGYHAIEFLLWGQDFHENSPGTRPYTDYVVGGSAPNPERRGLYLKLIADLLLDHLSAVKNEWEKDGAYRATFLSSPKNEVITKIFTALGEFSKGELSGERMFVAVDSKDQENEHSCFSDNTISDIINNFQGIVNVYTGEYTKVDGSKISGTSYAALATKVNLEKARAVDEAIGETYKTISAIPDPFDQAIIENEDEVLKAVAALEDLSDAFADVSIELKK